MLYQSDMVDPTYVIKSNLNSVYGLRLDEDYPSYFYLDNNNKEAKLHKALYSAFKGANVAITSDTADGKQIIVKVNSDINPGAFYLFNTKTMQAKPLFNSASWIKPQEMSPVEPFRVKTSDGLILIDAMNSNRQSEAIIAEGIRSLGMDPNDIRYLIITHAHGDHYGGQEYIVNEFKPRVVMSEADWTELEKPEPEIFNPKWGLAPTRDISIEDGHVIELGDTKVELYVTPGHTLGTISLIFPVKDGQQKHMAAMWGGTGLNFGPNIERLQMYTDSAARFKQLADNKAVDVFLSNHPTRDNSVERMQALLQRQIDQPHPFVDTNATGAFALLRDCSLARVVKISNYQDRVQKNTP